MAPRKNHEKPENEGRMMVIKLELPAKAAEKLVNAFRLGIFPSEEMKKEFPITAVDFTSDESDDDTR